MSVAAHFSQGVLAEPGLGEDRSVRLCTRTHTRIHACTGASTSIVLPGSSSKHVLASIHCQVTVAQSFSRQHPIYKLSVALE